MPRAPARGVAKRSWGHHFSPLHSPPRPDPADRTGTVTGPGDRDAPIGDDASSAPRGLARLPCHPPPAASESGRRAFGGLLGHSRGEEEPWPRRPWLQGREASAGPGGRDGGQRGCAGPPPAPLCARTRRRRGGGGAWARAWAGSSGASARGRGVGPRPTPGKQSCPEILEARASERSTWTLRSEQIMVKSS